MKIYVGNLSYRMTADELTNVFSQFGQVDKVDIIIDRDTGQSKGFGFIEMPVNGDAEKAIAELHGTEIGGRTITVNQAKTKTDAPRGPPPGHPCIVSITKNGMEHSMPFLFASRSVAGGIRAHRNPGRPCECGTTAGG